MECIPSIRVTLQSSENQGRERHLPSQMHTQMQPRQQFQPLSQAQPAVSQAFPQAVSQEKPQFEAPAKPVQAEYPFKGPSQSQAVPQSKQPQAVQDSRVKAQPGILSQAAPQSRIVVEQQEIEIVAASPEPTADRPSAQPLPQEKPQAKAAEVKTVEIKAAERKAVGFKATEPKASVPKASVPQENEPQTTEAKDSVKPQTRPQPAAKRGKAKVAPRVARTEKAGPTPEEKRRVDELLKAYPELPIDVIHTLILAGGKQKLCNSLRKNLGQEKGLELYNGIKSIIWK